MNGAILIAEDHEVARKSIQQYLQREGYRVEEAADGDSAIEAINASDFDLVITDLKMPSANGLDVLKHVREVSPNTLVIVTTAFGSVDSAIEALRLGAQDYVIKSSWNGALLIKALGNANARNGLSVQPEGDAASRGVDLDQSSL